MPRILERLHAILTVLQFLMISVNIFFAIHDFAI